MSEIDSSITAPLEKAMREILAEHGELPYPFCVHPEKCAGKSCCQRDPCCAD